MKYMQIGHFYFSPYSFPPSLLKTKKITFNNQ